MGNGGKYTEESGCKKQREEGNNNEIIMRKMRIKR
jgi:hypothetical protein